MGLREYRNEETFTQENLLNLVRNKKSLWHLNHKPPLSQVQHDGCASLGMCSQKLEFPFLPAPN